MYSDRILALFRGATHNGTAAGETHVGAGGERGAGPWMVLSARVGEGIVEEIRFQTYGCPTATACAEVACTLAEGKGLPLLQEISAKVITLCVGGVAEGKEHCAELTATALAKLIDGANGR
jgi:nitrogen fixation protein NifU and related proteins